MLAASQYLRRGAMSIFLSTALVFSDCDDEHHHVTQIIDDDLEAGNNWTFECFRGDATSKVNTQQSIETLNTQVLT